MLLKKYRFELLVSLLLIVSLGMRLYGLSKPDSFYFDEIYYAFTAQEISKGESGAWGYTHKAPEGLAYEWSHPPVGKEMSALGIMIFGDNPTGWRFFQAFFGGCLTLLIYLLAKTLFDSKRAGIFAAFLVTVDSLLFVESRIAKPDIFIVFFVLVASLFFVLYAKHNKTYYLYLTGAFCGVIVSLKWSGVLSLGFLGLLSLVLTFHHGKKAAGGQVIPLKDVMVRIFPKIALAFVVIPLAVYFLTYLPMFFYDYTFSDFIALQKQMYWYHSGLEATHPTQSRWWQWPLLLRSVFLYLNTEGDKSSYIYALGNPFIWWTSLGFFLYSFIEVLRKESLSLSFPMLCALAYWLPWSMSPRITFLYHFMPSLVFLILINSYFLDLLWRRSHYGKFFVIAYLIIACRMFIHFYPILAGIPIPHDDASLSRFFWIKGWR